MGNNQVKTAGDELAAMAKKIAQLEADNAALRVKSTAKVSMKVSELGAVSIYGMGRFPVTLYKPQWEALLAESQSKSILSFIEANAAKLSTGKDDPRFLKVRADRAAKAEAEAAAAPKTAL